MSQHLLPEWSPQSGVMLTWPHRESYWVNTLDQIDHVFTQTAYHTSLREKVWITCLDAQHHTHIQSLLKNANANLNNIFIYEARTNDIWVRDHGPITVSKNGTLLLLDFIFTGWGYKYPAEFDNVLTQALYQQQAFGQIAMEKIPLALEGGAIEVDGHGTLLTTRSCVLSKIRNPHMSEEEIALYLKNTLGVERILWLTHGALEGDDTDGHVDTLARFTDPKTICYVKCTDETDSHYATFSAMEKELQHFKDYQGNPYRLIALPWPQKRLADFDGRRLPITYANFLIINEAVLVPTYDDPADEAALTVIAQCFPDREIIAIPSLPVVQWYGSIHCMTMQLPRGVYDER